MRKLGLAAIAITIGLAFTSASLSQEGTMTGAGLRDVCGIPEPAWIDFCNGYAQAMFDTYHKPGEFICPGPDVSRADLAQEMYIGLTTRRDLADVNGSRAAAQVLAESYPC